MTLPPPTPACPDMNDPTQANFWANCLTDTNPGLVAFASYDVDGDLRMYTGSTNYLTGESAQILNNTTSLPLVISEVQNYDTGSSFVQMNNGTKGIFIDNDGNGEYLKYTLPPDFLTGSFSIEMSVRGSALNNPQTRFLFSTDTYIVAKISGVDSRLSF